MRAVDLAGELGVDAKRLRQWLRENFIHERNTPWELTPEQERQARERFGSPARGSPVVGPAERRSGGSARRNRDGSYVIDLCDDALGARAIRQHRFPWLVGGPGASGRVVQLPVDAYYPDRDLVVEYRERQHYESITFFDRRQTVSGVSR